MSDLTPTQLNILKALRYGRTRPTMRVTMDTLDCYDWRSLDGLFAKGYLTYGTHDDTDPRFTGKDMED